MAASNPADEPTAVGPAGEKAPLPRWRYVPDESPKRKHHWDKNEAGFEQMEGATVGKCPSNMSLEHAEEMLNTGIEYRPKGWNKNYPKRIYNMHAGVVYAATPTVPGQSYHGFPEVPKRVSPGMKKLLLIRAREMGFEKEVQRWLKSG